MKLRRLDITAALLFREDRGSNADEIGEMRKVWMDQGDGGTAYGRDESRGGATAF